MHLCLAAAWGLAGCNPPNAAGPPLEPVTTGQAFKGIQCSSIRPKTEPDLMAWDPGERANLNEIRQQGLVVVRYEAKGCDVQLQVLSNCDAPGKYSYTPYPSSNSIVINNMTELYGKLPLGAARFASKLHGDRALRTDYKLVGVNAIPIGTVVHKSDLRGDCKGATHVVSKIYVGGFALDAGEKRSIDAAATIFGAGAGARSVAGAEHLQSEGDPAACARAMSQSKPELGCSAPLRIALLPLGAPEHQCPKGSQWTGSGCQVSEVDCPSGTQWDGSKCIARVDTNCGAGLHFASGQGCVPNAAAAPASVATAQSTPPAGVATVKPAAHPGKMVLIPAGTFEMGSPAGVGFSDEHPQHTVHVNAFYMDLTEVTVAQYAACVAAGRCAEAPKSQQSFWMRFCNADRADRADHPENCVAWNMARDYCHWIGGRLPTEEEWEYAARGTDGRTYPWGNEPPGPRLLDACGTECAAALQRTGHSLRGQALYDSSDGWGTTAPVGSYPAGRSPFGLYDMAGNVWEWTSTFYCPYSSGKCASKSYAVRGGGWYGNRVSQFRAANRYRDVPSVHIFNLGFRCAR